MDIFMKYKNFRLFPSREDCLNDDIMPFIIPEGQNAEKDAAEISQPIQKTSN
jgi:hypothetical protein